MDFQYAWVPCSWSNQGLIKFSVGKIEVFWRLLSLQKANECCAIKELREKSVWKEKKDWERLDSSAVEGVHMDGPAVAELTDIQAN